MNATNECACGALIPGGRDQCSSCEAGWTKATKMPDAWSCRVEAGGGFRCPGWCGDKDKCVATFPTVDDVIARFYRDTATKPEVLRPSNAIQKALRPEASETKA